MYVSTFRLNSLTNKANRERRRESSYHSHWQLHATVRTKIALPVEAPVHTDKLCPITYTANKERKTVVITHTGSCIIQSVHQTPGAFET